MRLKLLSVVVLMGAAALTSGCNQRPYYYDSHMTPHQAGYVSSPYYRQANAKGYVSSYPSESMEGDSYRPYQRHYVSSYESMKQVRPAVPQQVYGVENTPQARDHYELQQWGFVHHRTMGANNYYIFRNVNHHTNLERAIETVTDGQTVELGQTASGASLTFTPNSPLYQTSRTGEWCREAFLEVVGQRPFRGIFCRQDRVPWALIR